MPLHPDESMDHRLIQLNTHSHRGAADCERSAKPALTAVGKVMIKGYLRQVTDRYRISPPPLFLQRRLRYRQQRYCTCFPSR
jgi:hypothetical protein